MYTVTLVRGNYVADVQYVRAESELEAAKSVAAQTIHRFDLARVSPAGVDDPDASVTFRRKELEA